MQHLMVTGKNVKSIYTRQKTLEQKPLTDIGKTVKIFRKKSLSELIQLQCSMVLIMRRKPYSSTVRSAKKGMPTCK